MKGELLTLVVAAGCLAAKHAPVEAIKRVEASTVVLKEIMETPDKGIPQDLMDKAHCVVVPGLKVGGFIVGATYGKVVVACRKANGG